jgi:hydroxymethylpyrimidine pyrophosphatase-like HAD family hydrolase
VTESIRIDAPQSTAEVDEAARPQASYNLLRSLDELATLFLETIGGAAWLDAFLLAAGLNQIIEDALHRDPFRLYDASRLLRSSGRVFPACAAAIGESFGRVIQALDAFPTATQRRLVGLVGELGCVSQRLAGVIAGSPADAQELRRAAAEIVESLERLPSPLRASVLRLPGCFHGFDQRPEDAATLVRSFADAFPERGRRLLVVGVRTSGSYLSPLYAAFLRKEGYEQVDVLTARPGRLLLRWERGVVRDVCGDRGLALIVDDPPETGNAVADVVTRLRRLGFPEASVVLLLQLLEGQDIPSALQGYASVCLAWSSWAVHERLAPDAVASALADLAGRKLSARDVEPRPLPASPRRGHARALFRVRFPDEPERLVLAAGVGLGYFGTDGPAVAGALRPLVPEVIGVQDGVLYREWVPEERRARRSSVTDEELAGAIAAYASTRTTALPVREDLSLLQGGDLPAWEAASNVLSRAFGRGWPAARVLFVDGAAKRLLPVSRPCLVDGWMNRTQWFVPTQPGRRLIKVGFYERAHWHLGPSCFDPLYDLAGATAGEDAGFVEALRHAYEERTGEVVDAERLLLYEIAHLWNRRRLYPEDEPAVSGALATALRRYFVERLLANSAADPGGPLCALDLDGVLETEELGFSSTTLSGALALRGLLRHGYRPILASGRSIDDVVERCEGYGLPGGVAEYGAAIVVEGVARSLLSDEDEVALERIRETLGGEDVLLDAGHQHSARAYRLDRSGRRRGLGPATVERVRERVGDRATVIVGEAQTDFVPAGIDKGTGLAALLDALGAGSDRLALAVGDTTADLPMLALAALGLAPAHAGHPVHRAGVERLRRPYQAGLALAVERLLGHPPGGCPVCRPPRLEPAAKLLMAVLSAQEKGRLGLLATALRLTARRMT